MTYLRLSFFVWTIIPKVNYPSVNGVGFLTSINGKYTPKRNTQKKRVKKLV